MGEMVPGSPHDPLVREALVACRLFAGLDATKLDLVIGALRARRFRRDEVIFQAATRAIRCSSWSVARSRSR